MTRGGELYPNRVGCQAKPHGAEAIALPKSHVIQSLSKSKLAHRYSPASSASHIDPLPPVFLARSRIQKPMTLPRRDCFGVLVNQPWEVLLAALADSSA